MPFDPERTLRFVRENPELVDVVLELRHDPEYSSWCLRMLRADIEWTEWCLGH